MPPRGCTTLWRFAGDGEVRTFALAQDGNAVFAADDHRALYKLDSTGAVLWRTEFPSLACHVAATSDGRYCCLIGDDRFLRFVIRDGREYWRVRALAERPFVRILAGRKRVAVGGDSETLKVYDFFGEPAEDIKLECRAHFVMEMGREGDLLVASEYGFIERLDRKNERLWRVIIQSGIGKPSVTTNGEFVVAPSGMSGMIHIDGSGAGARKFELPDPAKCACTDGAGRNVFSVTSGQELLVTNRAGVVAFRKVLPSPVRDIAASWSGHKLAVLYESGVLEVFAVGADAAEAATFYELPGSVSPTKFTPLRTRWCKDVFPRSGAVRSGRIASSGSGQDTALLDTRGRIRVFNAEGQEAAGPFAMPGAFPELITDETGSKMLAATTRSMAVYDFASRRLTATSTAYAPFIGLDVAPGLEFVVVADDFGSVELYDGELTSMWQRTFNSAIESVAALKAGGVAVLLEKGDLVCLSRQGEEAWRYALAPRTPLAVIRCGEMLVAGTTDGAVAALDADGRKLWSRTTDTGLASLTAWGGCVILRTHEGKYEVWDGGGGSVAALTALRGSKGVFMAADGEWKEVSYYATHLSLRSFADGSIKRFERREYIGGFAVSASGNALAILAGPLLCSIPLGTDMSQWNARRYLEFLEPDDEET